MKLRTDISGALALTLALAWPAVAAEKKSEEKKAPATEKAKAEKVAGDIGLLDTEKNYMIVVTKDGKLVTVDYNAKTKVSMLKDSKAKMSDVGLGSSAQVEYVTKGDKNFLSKMIFTPAKGE